jgi:DNA-binding PadR family transcriptional regulator
LRGGANPDYYYGMRYIGERSTDPGLLVLASLAGGPKHGYAITTDVEELAGVRLGPGTLYGALARLEERGLIESLPAEDRRRPYRLTAAGATALSEQLRAMERVARSGLARLRVAGATR